AVEKLPRLHWHASEACPDQTVGTARCAVSIDVASSASIRAMLPNAPADRSRPGQSPTKGVRNSAIGSTAWCSRPKRAAIRVAVQIASRTIPTVPSESAQLGLYGRYVDMSPSGARWLDGVTASAKTLAPTVVVKSNLGCGSASPVGKSGSAASSFPT